MGTLLMWFNTMTAQFGGVGSSFFCAAILTAFWRAKIVTDDKGSEKAGTLLLAAFGVQVEIQAGRPISGINFKN